jgi:hypothetical protein
MPKGDCYEAAAGFLIERAGPFQQGPDRYELVHAEIKGQGPLKGLTYGHGWVENLDTGFTFDMSNDREVIMPTSKYRQLSGVEEIGNEYRYDFEEARAKLLQHKHYGPWDLVTSSGL